MAETHYLFLIFTLLLSSPCFFLAQLLIDLVAVLVAGNIFESLWGTRKYLVKFYLHFVLFDCCSFGGLILGSL